MFNYGKLLESLVSIVIAIVTVDFFAWILHEEPSRIVGWVALGIAAAGTTTRD